MLDLTGTALTLLLFGLVIGFGLFLAFEGLLGLRRHHAFGLSFVAQAGARSLRELTVILISALGLLAGLVLLFVGVAWTYMIVYR